MIAAEPIYIISNKWSHVAASHEVSALELEKWAASTSTLAFGLAPYGLAESLRLGSFRSFDVLFALVFPIVSLIGLHCVRCCMNLMRFASNIDRPCPVYLLCMMERSRPMTFVRTSYCRMVKWCGVRVSSLWLRDQGFGRLSVMKCVVCMKVHAALSFAVYPSFSKSRANNTQILRPSSHAQFLLSFVSPQSHPRR